MQTQVPEANETHGGSEPSSEDVDLRARLRSRVRTAEVDAAAFAQGQLPGVCIHTGEPADNWVQASYKSRIGAQWFLILLGIFPLVLVRVLTVKRQTGFLPVNREATEALRAAISKYNSLKARTYFKRSLIVAAVLSLTVVAGEAAIVFRLLATPPPELASMQSDWDEVKAVLPVSREYFPDVDDYWDAYRETFAVDADGCIVRTEEDLSGEETYAAEPELFCRPTRMDLFETDELWPLVDSNGADYVAIDSYDGGVSTYSWGKVGYQVNPMLGVWSTVAVIALCIFGALVALRAASLRIRIAPSGELTRSGSRLLLRKVSPGFAGAARPKPVGMPAAPSGPPPPVVPAAYGTPTPTPLSRRQQTPHGGRT